MIPPLVPVLVAAALTALAVLLGTAARVRLPSGGMRSPGDASGRAGTPSHRMRGENGDATLTAAMLRVAIAQGAAVPHALIVVGGTLGGRDGDRLAAAGHALERGVRWRDAWRASAVGVPASGPSPAGGGRRTSSPGHRRRAPPAAADAADAADPLTTIGDALESSWTHGDSPVGRLSAAIEQIERETTADIERKAGALTVRLLVPTGLCFLPAFILIGVVPAIASFAW